MGSMKLLHSILSLGNTGGEPIVGKNTKGYTLVELMVVLAIMGILGTTLVTMMNTGGQLYRNSNAVMDAQSNTRLAMSYITMRIRQNDVSNGINVDTTSPFPVLKIIDSSNSSIPSNFYWIYFVPAIPPVPGKLREQYGTGFNTNLESGEEIADISFFTIVKSGTDKLRFEVKSADGTVEANQELTLRSP